MAGWLAVYASVRLISLIEKKPEKSKWKVLINEIWDMRKKKKEKRCVGFGISVLQNDQIFISSLINLSNIISKYGILEPMSSQSWVIVSIWRDNSVSLCSPNATLPDFNPHKQCHDNILKQLRWMRIFNA